MTDEQINKTIAEACGWKFIADYCDGKDEPPEYTTVTPEGKHLCGYYPDYCNDLNAMHEAEIGLDDMLFRTYSGILKAYVIGWAAHENEHIVIKATARQRAEAFLKTIGKWEEEA